MNSLPSTPFLAVGFLLTSLVSFAAPKAVLHDEVIKIPAITYPLPSGWKGAGTVQWDTTAEHPANVCVRTMVLDHEAQQIKAHYISAFETPIRHITTNATELAKLLEPAVKNMPGYTLQDATEANSQLMLATDDVREQRLARDSIRRALGNDVKGEVYLLSSSYAATHTDPKTGESRPCHVLCGAVVHERKLEEKGRKTTTASFHDIFIIAAPAVAEEKENTTLTEALSHLRRTMKQPNINRDWMHAHIRTMASAMDGMPKVDTKAINRIGEKAKEAITTGLPTVLGTLEVTARPPQQESSTPPAETE